jgi:hypothetical protein
VLLFRFTLLFITRLCDLPKFCPSDLIFKDFSPRCTPGAWGNRHLWARENDEWWRLRLRFRTYTVGTWRFLWVDLGRHPSVSIEFSALVDTEYEIDIFRSKVLKLESIECF